ncbi:hypothetical protein ARALYDRAFT_481095, partial [Arabidopsis lyrata subsp. lyrata]
KALGDQFPEGERYLGFENFGNTCYCNSVLQRLLLVLEGLTCTEEPCASSVFKIWIRELLLQHYANDQADAQENLLTCLADLFSQFPFEKSILLGYCYTCWFALFYLASVETMALQLYKFPEEENWSYCSQALALEVIYVFANGVHKLRANCYLGAQDFSGKVLYHKWHISVHFWLFIFDKFCCDKCCSLQEAQKRMKIKKPPHILVIHLKRFKYIQQLGRYKKLSYRVVFPLELKLSNTVDEYVDIEYSLFAVVTVEMIEESAVQTFFGSSQEYSSNTDHGYILLYESLGTR